MIDVSNVKFYQPIPFEGDWPEHWRVDCEERWNAIKSSIGDLTGKSLLDVGCANGYFMFRFVQDGGYFAEGIERESTSREFVNSLALEKGLNVKCFGDKVGTRINYDVGIYLDLHYDSDTDYLGWLKDRVGVLFISPSGNGDVNSERLKADLDKLYNSVITIHSGFVNRKIFKCEGVK